MENATALDIAKLEFTWLDYGLFSTMLILSALIGVYFGFVKKQSTANDYLLGGKEMAVIPIAMSLVASLLSGILLLAVPADIYRFGVTYWFTVPMLWLSIFLSYHLCLPIFYELQVTSTYEYLERRFDVIVRRFASGLFALTMFLYLPIVIYTPALALSHATSINVNMITPLICGICVFYTTVGGLKAVVWTDALQFLVMIGTIVVILVLAVWSAGGFGIIWQRNREYGRLNIDFSLDLTKRDTIWTGTIGLFTMWFSYAACNQGFMQKCLALPNYKDVRKALILFAIGTGAIISFSTYSGLFMFARYYDCDPLTSGQIKEPDQLLPHYMMDVGRTIPGLAGLFTVGIFSASLSTLSAVINCLSATIYEDFLAHFVKAGTSQNTISNYLKIISVAIGIINTGLVSFVPYMGSLMPLNMSLGGITNGAALALFVSGMFFPSINAKGALWGGALSISCMSWIVLRSQYYKMMNLITYPHLPVMTHGCPNSTSFANVTSIEVDQVSPDEEPIALYKISFYYYVFMGITISIVGGLVISKFTPRYNKPIGKKYFSPLIRSMINEGDLPPDYYTLEEYKKTISNKQIA